MMGAWRVLYHKSSLCLIVLALSSGCGMWINDSKPITQEDIAVRWQHGSSVECCRLGFRELRQ